MYNVEKYPLQYVKISIEIENNIKKTYSLMIKNDFLLLFHLFNIYR